MNISFAFGAVNILLIILDILTQGDILKILNTILKGKEPRNYSKCLIKYFQLEFYLQNTQYMFKYFLVKNILDICIKSIKK